jgi:hypothetical protein
LLKGAKVNIKIETGYSTVLLDFEKKENQYICVKSEGDMNDLHQAIYTSMVNGNQHYQLVKEEYREQMVPGMLCVPSNWSYSKKYKGLSVKDALLIHKLFWGKDEIIFVDGEEIIPTEILDELETRLTEYEL